jgi:hypothetical protein
MDNKNVLLNYYPIDCYNIVSKTNGETNYLSSTYKGNLNNPNVIYSEYTNSPVYYQSTNIYIYRKSQDLGINYDAELVIEHEPTTSRNEKLFVVFLLSNDKNTTKKSLDNLILYSKMKPDTQLTTINMNDYLTDCKENEFLFFETFNEKNNKCKIIINPNIVKIKENINYTKNNDLFFKTNILEKIHITNIHGCGISYKNNGVISEGFTLGDGGVLLSDGSANDLFECEFLPIGSDMAEVYQIPINSESVGTTKNQEFAQLVMNNLLGFIAFIFVFVASPVFYNGVTGYICEKDDTFCNTPLFSIGTLHSLFGFSTRFDILLTSIFFILTIILITYGMNTGNENSKAVGVFLPFIYAVGWLGIYFVNQILKKMPTASTPS